MSAEEFISLKASKLCIGEHVRTSCPFCGRDRKGFRITRFDNCVSGKCYHAKCHRAVLLSGNKLLMLSDGGEYKAHKHQEGYDTELSLQLINDDDELMEYVCEKYPFNSHMNLRYEPVLNALVYQLQDFYGNQIGHELRKLKKWYSDVVSMEDWNRLQKTNITWYGDVPKLHYAKPCDTGSTVVLVEDWFSADHVANTVMPSVALLGTSLSYAQANQLRKHYRSIVIMLDPDATKVAYRMQSNMGLLFDKCAVVVPPDDPKNIHPDDLEELLNEYRD